MRVDKHWLLVLAVAIGAAVSVAVGAAIASKGRRRHQRIAGDLEHTTGLGSWEGEGGNLASTPAAPKPA